MIRKGEWLLILFNFVYVLPFTVFYLMIKNFEFLWYIVIFLILFFLVALTLRRTRFSYSILWGLSIWGLLHMMGGGVRTRDGVLYAFKLIPIWVTENFYILKYDQFVHAYLYFVMVFVIYHLVKGSLGKNHNKWLIYVVVALASVGIGGLNEIAEFIAVLTFPETGVGGYYNTAWDIVFNTFGFILSSSCRNFRS